MEHVKRAAIVPMDAGWSDLGSWSSVWDIGDKSDAGNVFSGDVIAENTEHTLIKAEHRLVGVAGVSGLTIVETADSVLVADREASQSIKTLVAKLEESGREESVTHRRIYRPWGWYESVDQGDRHQVKRILVNPGSRLSLQKHEHRAAGPCKSQKKKNSSPLVVDVNPVRAYSIYLHHRICVRIFNP